MISWFRRPRIRASEPEATTSEAEAQAPARAPALLPLVRPIALAGPAPAPNAVAAPVAFGPSSSVRPAPRDAYFAPGAYAVDDDQADARPAPAPAPAPPTLSVHRPWDEVTLRGFAVGRAELTSEHQVSLASLAGELTEILNSYPDTFLSAIGHAAASEAGAEDLGLRRAVAVTSALAALGVPAATMHAAGRSAEPSAPGGSGRDFGVVVQVIKRNFRAEHRAHGEERHPAPAAAEPHPKPTEAVRHRGPITEAMERSIDVEMKRLGLAASLRDPVRGLAIAAQEKGVDATIEAMAKDTHVDDKTREVIRAVLKEVLKVK
jgi:outer membrane protein OmpA-like peptidoglycan-associated protein